MRILIVVSRFNEFITEPLVKGAMETLQEHNVAASSIETIRVPGAFELPSVAAVAARSKKYSAIICLGCVIRGDTPHFDYVAGQTAAGLMQVGIETGIPVIFGVLTTDNVEQAVLRAGGGHSNKGSEAALAALETIEAIRSVEAK